MKKNTKILLSMQRKKIRWNDETDDELNQRMVLDAWPDLSTCVNLYYRLYPALGQHCEKMDQQTDLECSRQFTKSLHRHCTSDTLKLQVIDALTKLVYSIPCVGLANAPIKERTGLYHIRVSYFWRLFYEKAGRAVVLLEFCPHKKQAHSRRLPVAHHGSSNPKEAK